MSMTLIPVNIKINMNNGWVCPKCGRVYAPYIPECMFCKLVK